MLCLSSCAPDEVDLDDRFVMYKLESSYFSRIGLRAGGGIQMLVQGMIESYGCNSTHIAAQMTGGWHYYFEKATVLTSPYPGRAVIGPLNEADYREAETRLKLPQLTPVQD